MSDDLFYNSFLFMVDGICTIFSINRQVPHNELTASEITWFRNCIENNIFRAFCMVLFIKILSKSLADLVLVLTLQLTSSVVGVVANSNIKSAAFLLLFFFLLCTLTTLVTQWIFFVISISQLSSLIYPCSFQ